MGEYRRLQLVTWERSLIQRSACSVREKRQKETGEENPDLDDLLPYMRAKARDNARYANT